MEFLAIFVSIIIVAAALAPMFLLGVTVAPQNSAANCNTSNEDALSASLFNPFPIKIVNLTPHVINVQDAETGEIRNIPPSGKVARLSSSRETVMQILTPSGVFNLTRTVFGEVQDLPEPDGESIFIVSSLVAQAVPNRYDVFVPDDTFRDSEGRIVGCRSIATLAKL